MQDNKLRRFCEVIMKKILCILMSVVLSISFLTYTVGAEQIYSGDFLKEKYTVYDSSIANENIGGNVLISQDALQGKTEISCDFSISSDFVSGAINLVAKKLNKSDTDILVSFSFLKDDNSTFKLDCGNGFIVNSLDFDKIYSLVVQIDFNNRKYNVVLYENHDKNCLINLWCYRLLYTWRTKHVSKCIITKKLYFHFI